MKNVIIIAVVVVVALAAGAAGAFMMAKGGKAKQVQVVPVAKPKKVSIIKLDERTINLADTNAAHYVRIKLVLQLSGVGSIKDVEKEHKDELMDTEISVIGKYTYQLLLSSTGKQSLKKELKEGFTSKVKDSGWTVDDVLMTDFLME